MPIGKKRLSGSLNYIDFEYFLMHCVDVNILILFVKLRATNYIPLMNFIQISIFLSWQQIFTDKNKKRNVIYLKKKNELVQKIFTFNIRLNIKIT